MSFNACPAPIGSVTAFDAHTGSPFSPNPAEIPPPLATFSGSDRRPSNRSDVVQMIYGCERELKLVQSRLGTHAEQADDSQLARELAHKAGNLRFAIELWEQIMARRSQPLPAA